MPYGMSMCLSEEYFIDNSRCILDTLTIALIIWQRSYSIGDGKFSQLRQQLIDFFIAEFCDISCVTRYRFERFRFRRSRHDEADQFFNHRFSIDKFRIPRPAGAAAGASLLGTGVKFEPIFVFYPAIAFK